MPLLRRSPPASDAGSFHDVSVLGSNPGSLTATLYLPDELPADAPLVVVLHGCTQTAKDYAQAVGWTALAQRHGFALLLPQQQRANNANLCFNWFEPRDIQRGLGEVASIKAMIGCAVGRHALDPARVFVTGLSAGAAMAAAMLATYPEAFAGGGLIAGLPYGTAASVQSALQRMRNGTSENGAELARHIQAASDHHGPWPRVSIWHGDADHTVASINGEASAAQWTAVHGLADAVPLVEQTSVFRRTAWRDASGQPQVELIEVRQMGHGAPIDLRVVEPAGHAAPFVLDAAVASSEQLLAFWGIIDATALERKPEPTAKSLEPRPVRPDRPRVRRLEPLRPAVNGIEKVINDALRSAGLMK